MKKSVIYSIINLKTKQWYIGSSIDFDSRQRAHLYELRNNRHHNPKLQYSWNKYGEESFIFHIIEYCTEENHLELEQIYLDGLNPYFNLAKTSNCPMKGRKHTEETKNKMSGKEPWNLGIPRTEEEKALMSSRRKEAANNQSIEIKNKHSQFMRDYIKSHGAPFKGKTHTEENRKILREKHKSKQKIMCIETGEIFEAQIDITRKYGLRQGHISEHLANNRPNVKGFKFKYV